MRKVISWLIVCMLWQRHYVIIAQSSDEQNDSTDEPDNAHTTLDDLDFLTTKTSARTTNATTGKTKKLTNGHTTITQVHSSPATTLETDTADSGESTLANATTESNGFTIATSADAVAPTSSETTLEPRTTEKPLELNLKACCGTHCVTFDNLMSMVGLQCCGESPVNAFEKICCSNQVHVRHAGAKYFDRCCADKPYAWDQVCCRGKVYDGVPQASCCGDLPYSIYDRTSICCGEQLHKIPTTTGNAVCCGDQMYDDRAGTHFCCGDKLYPRATHNGCCHPHPLGGVEFPSPNQYRPPGANARPRVDEVHSANGTKSTSKSSAALAEGYNSTLQMCCDRVYDRREYDFCCYVADVNAKQWIPPRPKPYNSKTHCCDGMNVYEMDQNSKSCGQH